MNISKILNPESYNNNEISIINTFISGLSSIKNIFYIEGKDQDTLQVEADKNYYFNKPKNKKMYLQTEYKKHLVIYNIYNNELMPVYSVLTKQGGLVGLGNNTREQIHRKKFEILYMDDNYKVFAIYVGNKKDVKDIIVGIETHNVEKKISQTGIEYKEINKIINYFNVEVDTLSTKSKPLTDDFKLEFFNQSKKIYSNNAADIFIKNVSIDELFYNNDNDKREKELFNFISIYEITTI